MRCQYVLPSDDMCVRAGLLKVLFRLPNGDRILIFSCQAHEQALGAVEWAERKRAG